MKAKLILENGAVFQGVSMGAARDRICEMVFNTSMVGYQELLTDPACAGLGVVMTYPLIGNYGVNSEDNESRRCWAEALVVRKLCQKGSNFRCEGTLDDFLKAQDVTGICGVDTRAITRMLREQGAMNGLITTREDIDMEQVLAQLAAHRSSGLVAKATRSAVTVYGTANPVAHVALYDFGCRESLIRSLVSHGCTVSVLPANTPAEDVLRGGYDGVVLSDGPGDPAECAEIIAEVRKLYEAGIPMLGICLGHQLLALAAGGQTEKMNHGHRGGNHPVRALEDGHVYITAQNHGYVVASIDPAVAEITHVNANDNTIEGLCYCSGRALSTQFQPDTRTSLTTTGYLFDRFVALMGGNPNA